jgi:hypothetical protein
MATFRDAIAADTAPSAMQTTVVIIDRLTGFLAVPRVLSMVVLSFIEGIFFL